ncbi:FG-GAP repeat domain-containing protein [Qingshengfaniella alkalisoli]|uniref:VCBS repeat-containing protein n=1 Tax=Qingshengfaniella alkalisoli TaxID=2599296 RepID=A0A5B8J5H0_9RHOB|nr:VCBS repeat-containing protein [Qingshengfaniella alkalisoli]QDY69580.1 VCBS repeat-containing protein [Qingshengfaniella alkalisoli]
MMPLAAGLLMLWSASAAMAESMITAADYTEPTNRYPHGALGDDIEYGALRLRMSDGRRFVLRLRASRVFEDTAPRLADLDGDGDAEVVVVEADASYGARLSIYDETGLVAATPFIGQRFRWLAPVGVEDFDRDGTVEIAYVDRPHLARQLNVWRYTGEGLERIGVMDGLTNHRFGELTIRGGVRDCGAGPEMVVEDAAGEHVVLVTLGSTGLTSRTTQLPASPEGYRAALSCQ